MNEFAAIEVPKLNRAHHGPGLSTERYSEFVILGHDDLDSRINTAGRSIESRLAWSARVLDGFAIIAATGFVLTMECLAVPHSQGVANLLAGVMAVLFLFAVSRGPDLRPSSFLEIFWQQVRYRAAPLLFAAGSQAATLSLLGSDRELVYEHSVVWSGTVFAGVVAARVLGNLALRLPALSGHWSRKIAIVGSDARAFMLADRLSRAGSAIEVVGVFDGGGIGFPARPVGDLVELSQAGSLYGVILAMAPVADNEAQILRVSQALSGLLSDLFVMPYLVDGPDVALPMQMMDAVPVMVLRRRPLDEFQAFRKRILDVAISGLACLVLLPVFLAVAAAIKMESPGPVFFKQPRRGFNNSQFTVFKFRSMYFDFSDVLAARQTSRDDPRVTRVGKWLRRLSLDELPQLLNVLRGEMSLVGPRPHALHTSVEGKHLHDAIAEYVLRYRVKPGITGWAQVNGARGELVTTEDLRRRLDYDFKYIQNWSIAFDLKILALTVLREVVSPHAY